MNEEDDTLKTGTLFWIKAGGRGTVAVPLDYLNEEQKLTLKSGLENGRYEYAYDRYRQNLNAHHMWEEKNGAFELWVTDIDLSLEVKRQLSPGRKVNKVAYRSTLTDMKRLRAEFEADKVDEPYVRDILSNLTWRPWQYSEWKELRDKKIQSACETCGETEDLILQHTRQPQKTKDIVFALVGKQFEAFLAYAEEHKNEIELPIPENVEKVPVCPKCGSSRVRHRLRKDNYVCEKTRNYVICKHEFTIPDYGMDERVIKQAEKDRRSLLRDRYCKEQGIYQQAAEIALEEIVSYLEMNHVKTLCRKCAFIEDRTTQVLCRFCGKNYHPKRYAMCKDCLEK